VQEDRRDAAEADEDGGGGDEKYEIKALRKTVGSGGKGRDNVTTYGERRTSEKTVIWSLRSIIFKIKFETNYKYGNN